MSSPLFVPLKTAPFRDFACGRKRVEYRPLGPRWNPSTIWPGRPVIISHGYSVDRIAAKVRKLRVTSTRPAWWEDYYPGHTGPIAAIHLDLP